jgi:hypothetical protein
MSNKPLLERAITSLLSYLLPLCALCQRAYVEAYIDCTHSNLDRPDWARSALSGEVVGAATTTSTSTSTLTPSTSTTTGDASITRASPTGAAPVEELRVFVDGSVVEVYADKGAAVITRRAYPTLADATGVALFNKGGGECLFDVTAWAMAPGREGGRG